MDKSQKKTLVEEWKNRRPEMGVISLRCRETGETFLGPAKDTKAGFNSIRAKLSGGWRASSSPWPPFWSTRTRRRTTPRSWRPSGSCAWRSSPER